MPEIDLDDIPANSSVAEHQDVTEHQPQPDAQSAQTERTDTAPAESSPANGDTEKADLLKVVRDAAQPKEEKPAAASPADDPEKDPQRREPEKDDENYTDVPFHKHPRFQQVLREKKTYQVDAQRYQNVQMFLDQHGLGAEEAGNGLMIMGLAKTDPVECWKLLLPFAQKVALAAGVMLPSDLEQEVTKGALSHDVALRIATERAQRQSVETRSAHERRQGETRRQQEHSLALSSAADGWAADRARKDPNFEAKQEALQKEIIWLHRTEGRPSTPEGVKAQCEKAYKAVNAALPSPVRQNGARPVTPIRGGQVSGAAPRTAPKSTVELINQTLDQTRRAASA